MLSCAAILVIGRDHQTQIWFSGFRGEDLNVIFYQNMPNLNNRYKSAERKIKKKNPNHWPIYECVLIVLVRQSENTTHIITHTYGFKSIH